MSSDNKEKETQKETQKEKDTSKNEKATKESEDKKEESKEKGSQSERKETKSEQKPKSKPKRLVHIDSFIEEYSLFNPLSDVQKAGFKAYMTGKYYLSSLDDFVPYIEKYLGK